MNVPVMTAQQAGAFLCRALGVDPAGVSMLTFEVKANGDALLRVARSVASEADPGARRMDWTVQRHYPALGERGFERLTR